MATYVTPRTPRQNAPVEHRYDRIRLAFGLAVPFLAAVTLVVR
jgi:hypothetical protein